MGLSVRQAGRLFRINNQVHNLNHCWLGGKERRWLVVCVAARWSLALGLTVCVRETEHRAQARVKKAVHRRLLVNTVLLWTQLPLTSTLLSSTSLFCFDGEKSQFQPLLVSVRFPVLA
jgi:hypothetical protein